MEAVMTNVHAVCLPKAPHQICIFMLQWGLGRRKPKVFFFFSRFAPRLSQSVLTPFVSMKCKTLPNQILVTFRHFSPQGVSINDPNFFSFTFNRADFVLPQHIFMRNGHDDFAHKTFFEEKYVLKGRKCFALSLIMFC